MIDDVRAEPESWDLESVVATNWIDQLHKFSCEYEEGRSETKLLRTVGRIALAIKDSYLSSRVWRWGKKVEQVYGVSVYRQILQLGVLSGKYGFRATDYYRYRMYRLSIAEASGFLLLGRYIVAREFLYRKIRLDPTQLADKRMFYRHCSEVGLPIPQTIAEFDEGEVCWLNGRELPACDLFSKEAASMRGEGAMLWRFEHAPRCWALGKEGGFDERKIVNYLSTMSRQAPLVLQRRVSNHPDIADLGLSGLSTVRIVTIREPTNPEPKLLMAAFRIPAAGEVIDTFARGGIGCAVSLSSGVLGLGVRKNVSQCYRDFAFHPDTGARIEGRQLPLWNEVTKLALAAHEAFQEFPSIGWDIAITASGPVLIEGNYNWDVVFSQQVGFQPLGCTPFHDHFLSWLAHSNPEA